MLFVDHFDEFLTLAQQEPETVRLLLVFARSAPQTESLAGHALRLDAGERGKFALLASVDKDPLHLQSYAALAEEAQQKVGEWDAIFVAALPGKANEPPTVQEINRGGEKMVQAICDGRIESFLLFDREGKQRQLPSLKARGEG